MNLFLKSYRVYLIFFLLITCETCVNRGFAQQSDLWLTPWIQEINLPSPYNEIPNETLFRDLHGTLFIGKENGLHIIDGRNISYIHMTSPVHVGGSGSDTLYFVSGNDLGFLLRQEDGTFEVNSRIHLIPASKRAFAPRGVQNRDGYICIYTNTGCFTFSGTEVKFVEKNSEEYLEFDPESPADVAFIELTGKEIGLTTDGIRQVFTWNQSEIWLLGTYTLHRIYSPSPLNFLFVEPEQTGRILTSMISRDRVFLGSSHGIFSATRDPAKPDHWLLEDLLPGSNQSVHMFSAINGQVFAAGSRGLYMIGENQAELIANGSFTGILAYRRGGVLAADRNGIVRYRLGRAGWESTRINQSLSSAHSFTAFNNSTYFLCDNEVFRINSRADKVTQVPFRSGELLYKLLVLEQKLYLIGNQQVYSYDTNEEIFHPLPESQRTRLFLRSDKILPAEKDNFWILNNRGDHLSRLIYTSNLDESSSSHSTFPVLPYLGEIIDMAYADSILFLTGKDRISFFDLHGLDGNSGEVTVQLLYSGLENMVDGFHISGLELQRYPGPRFRYRILPGENSWSRWALRRDYSISGLKHGKYHLEVQAMDLFGRISGSQQVPFSIPTPLYARWYAYLLYGLLLSILLLLFRKWRLFSYRRAESRIAERMELKIQKLAAEKEQSDKLVADLLPEATANKIKSTGKARWDKYERATVLFSDIQGFTRIAEEMNPERLIDELDSFFFHFDSVVDKYNIEKIKTIGDAYMAAGGIPHKNSTNPVEVVMAALEMQAYMQQLKSNRAEIWDLRIGIHTGPVIAGVIGHKKISYDIWGDTVNTASRMESSGTPGKINISGITYSMVKDYFLCEFRGKLPVKYKGNIDMYYVTGLRPELSVDLKTIPNKRFYMQLQLLRLGDLEEKVFSDIIEKLPDTLHFHGPEYARRVYNQSFLLCRSEEIDQESRLLARTAALMLFTGLSQEYYNFENRSAVICRDILPTFSYSEKQIDQICNLILATKKPFNPNNRLEKILIDARMEYIGRPDYTSQIKLLFEELKAAGSKINGQQFKKQQLEELYEFNFYTIAAQRLREVSGNDQMTTLEQERWI